MNNFNKFYEKAKIEEEIEAKRKRTSWEDAKRGEGYQTIFYFLCRMNCNINEFENIRLQNQINDTISDNVIAYEISKCTVEILGYKICFFT